MVKLVGIRNVEEFFSRGRKDKKGEGRGKSKKRRKREGQRESRV